MTLILGLRDPSYCSPWAPGSPDWECSASAQDPGLCAGEGPLHPLLHGTLQPVDWRTGMGAFKSWHEKENEIRRRLPSDSWASPAPSAETAAGVYSVPGPPGARRESVMARLSAGPSPPGKAGPPCHIPLKSKCRGTSPGRSGSMAQRLGRQAVTALGRGPARLALTHPSPHPVWPGLTGVSQPAPSGQAGALHYRVPSRGLHWCEASSEQGVRGVQW
ncbi:unnamed protein product [Lota lota]